MPSWPDGTPVEDIAADLGYDVMPYEEIGDWTPRPFGAVASDDLRNAMQAYSPEQPRESGRFSFSEGGGQKQGGEKKQKLGEIENVKSHQIGGGDTISDEGLGVAHGGGRATETGRGELHQVADVEHDPIGGVFLYHTESAEGTYRPP